MEMENAYADNCFNVKYEFKSETGFAYIQPEMSQSLPTGRYVIQFMHPKFDASQFLVEQDDDCVWISKNLPEYLDDDLVGFMGDRIESRVS